MMRGALIVLEGVDRAGKSTQCQKLVDHIRNSGVSLIALIAGVVYSSYMQVFWCPGPAHAHADAIGTADASHRSK